MRFCTLLSSREKWFLLACFDLIMVLRVFRVQKKQLTPVFHVKAHYLMGGPAKFWSQSETQTLWVDKRKPRVKSKDLKDGDCKRMGMNSGRSLT